MAFDAINSSLQADDAERKDAVKKGNAIFAFKLKNKEGQEEGWHIDLKEKGAVGKGEAPEGKKADGEFGTLFVYLSFHTPSASLLFCQNHSKLLG